MYVFYKLTSALVFFMPFFISPSFSLLPVSYFVFLLLFFVNILSSFLYSFSLVSLTSSIFTFIVLYFISSFFFVDISVPFVLLSLSFLISCDPDSQKYSVFDFLFGFTFKFEFSPLPCCLWIK